jgi:hypothetical protein
LLLPFSRLFPYRIQNLLPFLSPSFSWSFQLNYDMHYRNAQAWNETGLFLRERFSLIPTAPDFRYLIFWPGWNDRQVPRPNGGGRGASHHSTNPWLQGCSSI